MDDGQLLALCEAFLADHDPRTTPRVALLGAAFGAGLANPHHPEGLGGLGLDARQARLVAAALREGGLPQYELKTVVGHGMAAPTIVAHGTPEQQERWLRRIYTGEDVWCQLFSEPGAGSDLAAVATRAERDGDGWVVHGQKVWTSFGMHADLGILVARTDPTVPKHKGLTYFAIDMRQPGVEVRPLRQMTGDAEFSEVHLDGARVDDADRIGDIGEGWRVAMTTLMNERALIGGATPPRGSGLIGRAVELWRSRDAGEREPALRERLVSAWVDEEALRLTNLRAAEAARKGLAGPEGSIAKLRIAEQKQRLLDLCVELRGPDALLYDYEDFDESSIEYAWLRARAATIEGGTSEVLRNVIGERVLGLPPEPRVDKTQPWTETARA